MKRFLAEWLRNFWLELTPNRIFLMPLLLGLLFFLAGVGDGNHSIPLLYTSATILFLLLHIWGSKQAADAIITEVNEATWDSQRMTLIQPFSLSFGKLFGSTIYCWYGSLFCIPVYLYNSLQQTNPGSYLLILGQMILSALMVHSLIITSSLLGIQKKRNLTKINSSQYFFLGILLSFFLTGLSVGTIYDFSEQEIVLWHGQRYKFANFYLKSLLVFSLWSFLALYRVTRRELNYSNGFSVWIAFLCFLAIYVSGFSKNFHGITDEFSKLLLVYATFHIITLITAYSEPKTITGFFWHSIRNFRNTESGKYISLWMISLVFCLLTCFYSLWMGFFSQQSFSHFLFPLNCFFFLTRDLIIILLAAFLPGFQRRELAALVYLLLLYIILPSVLNLFFSDSLHPFFYPDIQFSSPFSLLFPFSQTIFMFSVLFYLHKQKIK